MSLKALAIVQAEFENIQASRLHRAMLMNHELEKLLGDIKRRIQQECIEQVPEMDDEYILEFPPCPDCGIPHDNCLLCEDVAAAEKWCEPDTDALKDDPDAEQSREETQAHEISEDLLELSEAASAHDAEQDSNRPVDDMVAHANERDGTHFPTTLRGGSCLRK